MFQDAYLSKTILYYVSDHAFPPYMYVLNVPIRY